MNSKNFGQSCNHILGVAICNNMQYYTRLTKGTLSNSELIQVQSNTVMTHQMETIRQPY
jgi:hypothetical protein